jgi:tetratricopeptide (TPR) repeat protein
LLAAINLAAKTECDTHAWQLAYELQEFQERTGHWHDRVATQRVALTAAQRSGDQLGQAIAHRGLGSLLEQQGNLEQALPHAQQALALSEAAGYRLGRSKALNNIGWYHALLGNP